MTKTIIAFVIALGMSTSALAASGADTKVPPVNLVNGIDFAIVSETEHNIDAETTNTEFGLTAEKNGLTLSLLPNYDWDKEEVNNIELGISYDVEVTKSFSIVPYGEYHVDNSFNEKSKINGLRTAFKF